MKEQKICVIDEKDMNTYSCRRGLICPLISYLQLEKILQISKNISGGEQFTKDLIYRWSVTQNLNVTQQLQLGIRYFDMRVAFTKADKKL